MRVGITEATGFTLCHAAQTERCITSEYRESDSETQLLNALAILSESAQLQTKSNTQCVLQEVFMKFIPKNCAS